MVTFKCKILYIDSHPHHLTLALTLALALALALALTLAPRPHPRPPPPLGYEEDGDVGVVGDDRTLPLRDRISYLEHVIFGPTNYY